MAGLTVTVGGNDITAYVDVRSIYVEEVGTRLVGTAGFDVRDHSGTVAIAEKDAVAIVDDGTTLFAGEVATINEGQTGIAKTWTVRCQDWNILLDETAVESESYEAGGLLDSAVIDDLFSTYRSDVNSTTYVATIDSTMEDLAFAGMTLREIMDEMCRRTGGRYYVDYEKNLHYFTTESNPAAFSLSSSPNGSTSFGFGGFRKSRSVTKLANKVFVLGKSVSGWVQDATSIAAYGERHAVSRDERITTAQGVTDRGTAIIEEYKAPTESYELWTEKDGLRAGQSIDVVNAVWGIDSTFYIRKLRMEVLGRDGERRRYHLQLNDEVQSADLARRDSGTQVMTLETTVNQIGGTIYDTTAPSAPLLEAANLTTGVDVDADGHQVVYLQVTWGEVSDADLDHYQLQVSTSSDFSGYAITRDHPAGGGRIERFVGILGNTTYYVRARAVDWCGNNSDWSTTQSKATSKDSSAPAQVADLSAGSSRTLVGLQWTANSEGDLAEYEIQRAPDSSGSPGTYATIAKARLSFYIDQDFTNEQIAAEDIFWYRVRAIDTSGNAGSWSTADSATLGQIDSDHLAASCITADKVAANAITAEKIFVAQLSAIAADMGTITAGTVTGATIRTAASGARIVMDSTDGIRVFNSSGTLTAQIDVDGSGQIGASGGTVPPLMWNSSGQIDRIQANQLQIGDQVFNNANGLLLLGPNCEISTTEWKTARGMIAALTGAFHQEQGRWMGTRALVVEPGTTNLITNPSFESNVTDYWGLSYIGSDGSRTQDTSYAYTGAASCKLFSSNDGYSTIYASSTISVANGSSISFQCRILRVTVDDESSVFIDIHDYTNSVTRATAQATAFGQWERLTVSWTNTTGGSVNIRPHIYNLPNVDSSIYIDACQLEMTMCPTSYCDGTLAWCAWSGTAHASTSTRTATVIDLDDHAALMTGRDPVSFRCVVQAPQDYDDAWITNNAYVFDLRGADNNNRIALKYDAANNRFSVYVNGAERVTSSGVTFSAGDMLDLVVTLNFAGTAYLYVDGEAVGSADISALSAPTLTAWRIGSNYSGSDQGGWAISEYGVFDAALAAAQVAQLYNLQRPLVDAGAFTTPGIYILDGKFRMASSTTGNRIEMTADEIAGYDSAGTKQFYLRASDGAAVAGGGNVVLDEDGVRLTEGDHNYNIIRWVTSGGTLVGSLMGNLFGTTTSIMEVRSEIAGATYSKVDLIAQGNSGTDSSEITLFGGSAVLIGFNIAASQVARIDVNGLKVIGKVYIDDDTHYLYKSGDDLYWKPGSGSAVKLN